ncbi:hypothetical protein HDV00_002823 [Rhizophlyctis rosea]|nr:hypothetical protein HDV00_002823 [Rhizophlyctis rosea]
MPDVQTLPDILLLLFASPTSSVADLLKCERVCKQWCTLIRSNQIQIWKQKLVDGFPKGCLPVLYENELWRDAAVLWWAWRAPWVEDEDGEMFALSKVDEEVEEVKFPKTLRRRGGGIVRDLATVIPVSCNVVPRSLRSDGQIVLLVHSRCSVPVRIDVLFAETKSTARPISNVACEIDYLRTNIIGKQLNDGNLALETWDTGTSITHPAPYTRVHAICGSQVLVYPNAEALKCKVISLDDRTSATVTLDSKQSGAINQTFLAYIAPRFDPDDTTFHLILLSLLNKQQIASFFLQGNRTTPPIIYMTRFNIFCDYDDKCWVFDFNLTLMYKLPKFLNTGRYVSILRGATDFGLIFLKHLSASDFLWILDGKTRVCRHVPLPCDGMLRKVVSEMQLHLMVTILLPSSILLMMLRIGPVREVW